MGVRQTATQFHRLRRFPFLCFPTRSTCLDGCAACRQVRRTTTRGRAVSIIIIIIKRSPARVVAAARPMKRCGLWTLHLRRHRAAAAAVESTIGMIPRLFLAPCGCSEPFIAG
ncbi:hypothetical protein HPB47_002341 [Ixodes persulcatus]|uniref:Uncharacterized protein n=1 Tax=Ixodes persulcatus TaxID=34615 RepID=A0AC60PLU6_IXOPE|nr:hypothetical protein HPB47_002341 [Ixodes persulcatus]